jgi:hypothetical protein
MEAKAQLNDYLMRAKRYDNIDGTNELMMGAMLLGFVISGYVEDLARGTFWTKGFPANLAIILGPVYALLGLCRWVTRGIKRRITYPRTGYAALPGVRSSIPAVVGAAILAAAVAAGLFFLVRTGARHHAVMLPRVAGVMVFCATYGFFAWRLSREHTWKLPLAGLLTAGLLAFAFLRPADTNNGFYRPAMMAVALTWFLSGGITLWLYMRRTEPAGPDAQ